MGFSSLRLRWLVLYAMCCEVGAAGLLTGDRGLSSYAALVRKDAALGFPAISAIGLFSLFSFRLGLRNFGWLFSFALQLENYCNYIVYRLVIALHAGGRTSDCVVVLCDVGGRENFSDMVYNEINGNCKKYIVTTKNNNDNENNNKGNKVQKRQGISSRLFVQVLFKFGY